MEENTWTDEADYQAEMADERMMRERHLANALAAFDAGPTDADSRRWHPAGSGLDARSLGTVAMKRADMVRLDDYLIVPEIGEGKVTFIWDGEGCWLFQVESPPGSYTTLTFPEDQMVSVVSGTAE